MRTYRGWRDEQGNTHVVVRTNHKGGRKLNPRFDLDSHSLTGFEWGYGGSGPAQLALALLADALDDDDRALRLHQQFKWAVIAGLARDETWSMNEDMIRAWANRRGRKRSA